MASKVPKCRNEIVSERIHDADSETNENLLHWLQLVVEGQVPFEELAKRFNRAYVEEEHVFPPWHEGA